MATRDLLNRLPAPVRWLAPPAVLLACTAGLVASWSGDPDVTPPVPSAEAAQYCRALDAALPAEVLGHARKDPSPASPYTAAWASSPRTVLTCGGERPEFLDDGTRTGPCVNEVSWGVTEDGDGGYRFATGLRKAYVVVEVPAGAYGNYADPLGSLADAVRSTVPTWDGKADSGCLDGTS
ncbi:hypothetical protein Kpho02_65120 [Kitasatospora phosalacinea]|uniref:DUF3515 domain-containing protein n=1 Tax=Kitasatospora phosalacinea TaxID=2065 RepID=A0A9W6QFQ8_9ACTN|nr:DUF3515 domain-containing protein [Kitasatospora phosalacinea]GLW74214.1 hypothetical protein Kpho02_65120 [Kitasatospora phosalacinea]